MVVPRRKCDNDLFWVPPIRWGTLALGDKSHGNRSRSDFPMSRLYLGAFTPDEVLRGWMAIAQAMLALRTIVGAP